LFEIHSKFMGFLADCLWQYGLAGFACSVKDVTGNMVLTSEVEPSKYQQALLWLHGKTLGYRCLLNKRFVLFDAAAAAAVVAVNMLSGDRHH
jgi:hypothetical protein